MKFIQFIREKQKIIHFIMLLAVVALYVLKTIGIEWSAESSELAAFSILAYILFDVSQNTYSYSRNKLYPQDKDLFPDLLKWIDEKGAREVQVIQYSGTMVSVILRALLEKGAEVNVWLEDPKLAISAEQRKRITSSLDSGFLGELNVKGPSCLKVNHYQIPASIRGILIDGKLLVVGWYTYEHILKCNEVFPDDCIEISGNDRPSWVLYEGTPEFSILRGMFEAQLDDFAKNQLDKKLPVAFQNPPIQNSSNLVDAKNMC